MTRLMSFWARAIDAAMKAVTAPMTATTSIAVGAEPKIGCERAIR